MKKLLTISCLLISFSKSKKKLIKIFDILGRQLNTRNQPLIYMYNDGVIEKKLLIRE